MNAAERWERWFYRVWSPLVGKDPRRSFSQSKWDFLAMRRDAFHDFVVFWKVYALFVRDGITSQF